MIGKCYYLTTFADWKRRSVSFTTSHWLNLDQTSEEINVDNNKVIGPDTANAIRLSPNPGGIADGARILVLVEADEGTHGSLQDDAAFEALPHPLSQKPISEAAQSALAPHGVAPGALTFDATETISRVHPLLKHRVF